MLKALGFRKIEAIALAFIGANHGGVGATRQPLIMCHFTRRTHVSKEPIEMEDDDVTAEKERVLSGGARGDLIRIENLTKVSLWIFKMIGFTIARRNLT